MIKREVQIGDCRLILGDCLEVMPALGKVDAVVTDPPMGLGETGKKEQLAETAAGSFTNSKGGMRRGRPLRYLRKFSRIQTNR